MASEVFHDFFAYDFGGGEGRISRKIAVAVGKEFGSADGELGHEDRLLILAGKTRIQRSLQGRDSSKSTVARDARLERNLEWRKGNFVTKNARSRVKEFATGMKIEIAFLLPLFFLLGQLPPSLLDRKSSNLLHQCPNLPFQSGAEGGALEIRENSCVHSIFDDLILFPINLRRVSLP